MTLCGLQLKVRQLKYLFSVCVEGGSSLSSFLVVITSVCKTLQKVQMLPCMKTHIPWRRF